MTGWRLESMRGAVRKLFPIPRVQAQDRVPLTFIGLIRPVIDGDSASITKHFLTR